MATTKFSVSAYTADGVTTDFLITWDYLDEDHIAVYVDGTPNYDPTSTYTFEQINATTLRITDEFGNAVPSGSAIEIRRETPIATRAVTFVDGSSFLAEDLNKNSDYLLYSMQEALDTVEAAAQDGALAAQVATEALRDETQVLRNETEVLKDTAGTYLATVQADATAADNHRIAAAASEAAAATSETNAATSENNAAASATASATSAANALASEQASATSEAAALASQQAAETAEIGAAASATAAATSETNAAASATAAATSEANAAATLASVEGIYDQFDDRYLGPKATDPVTDNDGNPLVQGTLYFSTSENVMKVYDGANWDAATSAGGASLLNYNFTATAGQTAFSGVDDNSQTLSYAQNNIIVTLNGITLEDGTDYTATDGITITLTSAAAAGDELNVVAFKTFAVADTVSASNGGTFSNPITVNRATSDGTIIDLQKDGSSVGSIGVASGQNALTIGNADTGLSFQGNQNDAIFPYNVSTNALRDNAISLGYSSSRFKDLYLSGGVYLGGTGAANYLDDYEEGVYVASITCSISGSITLNTSYDELAYTKIGNIVHVHGRIRVSSVSSPNGVARLSLPFTSASLVGDSGRVSGVCYLQNGSNNMYEYAIHPTFEALSYVELARMNGTSFDTTIADNFSGNELVFVSITYRTT